MTIAHVAGPTFRWEGDGKGSVVTRRGVLGSVVLAMPLAYVVSLLPGVRPHAGFAAFWDVGVYAAVLLSASAACAVRARFVIRDRLAWLLIAAGLASYGAGTVLFFALFSRQDEVPYPSASDGLWLLLYPMAIVGIGLMARARMAGSVASMWLDGLVSGLGLVSLSASLVFPRVTAEASGTAAAIVTNFAYPLLDLALLATIVGAMAALGAWRERTWQLLGAGFLAFATADSWYLLQVSSASYTPGGPVDALYQWAAALIALAAVVSGRVDDDLERSTGQSEGRSFLVPGSFALVAVAVLVVGAWGSATPLAIVLAVGALSAAWARTAITVREVVQLSDSRRQARTDALTGLPNRRAFYELLADIDGPQRNRQSASAVVLFDLDRFKEINDALGHQVGDLVLAAVSKRLAAHVPQGATIARLGGDELALLLPASTPPEAAEIARRLLDALQAPFLVQDISLHLDASVGITDVTPGVGVSRALAQADLAMYRAKAARTGLAVYDEQLDGDAGDRLATLEALRLAISRRELAVHFQPIVTPGDAQLVGVEALVRWHDADRGWVPPDRFLPLAEHAGLMSSITRAVLDLSLDQACELRNRGLPVPVAVNLSASDLLDVGLVDHIAGALASRNLTGAALKIEITESLLVVGREAAEFLEQLRRFGIALAVDDYGTGYSCMAYLHELPVSSLKIDRGFTDRILTDPRTAVIVDSTIQMAHRLGLQVVAEGVETAEQLEWMIRHDCDLLQGYYVSKPLTGEALLHWAGTRRPTSDVPTQPTHVQANLTPGVAER
jgi:diguanylate cyclase